jgi:hypothetical protein
MSKHGRDAGDFEIVENPKTQDTPNITVIVGPGRRTKKMVVKFIELYEGKGIVVVEELRLDGTVVVKVTPSILLKLRTLGFEVYRPAEGPKKPASDLPPEVWESYMNEPLLRQEYSGEKPKTWDGRRPVPADNSFARFSAKSLGLKPGDWSNPEYRDAYQRHLIIADAHSQFFLISPGQRSVEVLEKFLRDLQSGGLKVHRPIHPVEESAVIEVNDETRRLLEEERFKLQPVEVTPQPRRR